MKNMNTNIEETQQTLSRMNSKRPTQRHATVKLSENKEKESSEGRRKQLVTYKGSSIRLSANFSSETL